MKRIALILGLLLAACASGPTDAGDASDATVFETSTESAVPPLNDIDASVDGG